MAAEEAEIFSKHTSLFIAFRQRHVAQIVDAADLERREIERHVVAAVVRRDMAHRARAQMLVALGRSVAGGMRDANQRDVGIRGIVIVGARNSVGTPHQ